MLELFTAFSVKQIIIFTIMLALAIRGGGDFFDWCRGRYERKFNKDHNKLNKQIALEEHYEKCKEQHIESIEHYTELKKKIDLLTEVMDARLDVMEESIDKLTESDMHSIKSWIVEKHHKLMKQGKVDDFTMDTLEKRFGDYKKEGGNSYIDGLMEEMRALPHVSLGED